MTHPLSPDYTITIELCILTVDPQIDTTCYTNNVFYIYFVAKQLKDWPANLIR